MRYQSKAFEHKHWAKDYPLAGYPSDELDARWIELQKSMVPYILSYTGSARLTYSQPSIPKFPLSTWRRSAKQTRVSNYQTGTTPHRTLSCTSCIAWYVDVKQSDILRRNRG